MDYNITKTYEMIINGLYHTLGRATNMCPSQSIIAKRERIRCMRKKVLMMFCMGICLFSFTSCGNSYVKYEPQPTKQVSAQPSDNEIITAEPTKKPVEKPTKKPTKEPIVNSGTIVIDAGHQAQGNSELEPIGPGASEKKAKVASGTQGVSSGVPEYKVTLQVAEKLRDVLEERGYQVIMVRESNDVNISNAERAEIANKNNADAFLRLHCNGVENSSATGALALCQTKNNPYCADQYDASRKLSECVLNGLCDASGAKNTGVREVDNMSGINWCQVPVTIIEMGYMTNPQEDTNLNTPSYQQKLAEGMADGIENYLK